MSTTTAAYWINAARDGDLEKVKALLDNGMDVNYIMDEDNYGWTALHYACQQGHRELVECLLEAGAYVNIITEEGRGVLYDPARAGCLDIVNLLLAAGANDINHIDDYNSTPLSIAIERNHLDIVSALLNAGGDLHLPLKKSWLHLAIEEDDFYDMICLLLNRGCDVNVRDEEEDCQYTALQYAVWHWKMDIVILLLDHGADVNALDKYERSVLYYAVFMAHNLEITRLLLQRGANLEIKDKLGKTVLERLVEEKEKDEEAKSSSKRAVVEDVELREGEGEEGGGGYQDMRKLILFYQHNNKGKVKAYHHELEQLY